MNSAIVGAVATLVTLGAIGVAADKKPPAPAPAGQVTPEQLEAIQRTIQGLTPGAKVRVEVDSKDGGTVHTLEEGTGKGASATAEGDKLNDSITGDAPLVNRGSDGSASAKGGSADRDTEASGLKLPPLPWANPLFWIGVACLGGAGAGVYFGLRKLALYSGIAGVGALAAAFYPAILLWAVAGVILVLFGPYVWAEFKRRQAEQATAAAQKDADAKREALRAVVAGVDDPSVPPDLVKLVKNAISIHADGVDKKEIDAIKRADKIGKFKVLEEIV